MGYMPPGPPLPPPGGFRVNLNDDGTVKNVTDASGIPMEWVGQRPRPHLPDPGEPERWTAATRPPLHNSSGEIVHALPLWKRRLRAAYDTFDKVAHVVLTVVSFLVAMYALVALVDEHWMKGGAYLLVAVWLLLADR